jgi:hypothetical protein
MVKVVTWASTTATLGRGLLRRNRLFAASS